MSRQAGSLARTAQPVVVNVRRTALVQTLRAGTFSNAGQDCTAATRLLVHESLHADFLDAAVELAESIVVGDPLALGNENVEMGPLASGAQRARVHLFVEQARADGARSLDQSVGLRDRTFDQLVSTYRAARFE
jgi:acyl-CoA reductase-like NAD-dependent aldehyde dehydrogenase